MSIEFIPRPQISYVRTKIDWVVEFEGWIFLRLDYLSLAAPQN